MNNPRETNNYEEAVEYARKVFTPPVSNYAITFDVYKQIVDAVINNEKVTTGYAPSAEQYRALITNTDNLLMDAGPGSGKTTTLIKKIIVNSICHKLERKNFVALSYSRASANALLYSFSKDFSRWGLTRPGYFGTIHSFARFILASIKSLNVVTDELKSIEYQDFEGLSEEEIEEDYYNSLLDMDYESITNKRVDLNNMTILKEAIENLKSPHMWKYSRYLDQSMNAIIEHGLLSRPNEYWEHSQTTIAEEVIARNLVPSEVPLKEVDTLIALAEECKKIRKKYKVLNFSDMLVDFWDTLSKIKTLDEIENGFVKGQLSIDYLYIDEFQDISPIQWDIIIEIKRLYPNMKLICVGDADQAIYSFRGASTEPLITFQDIVTGESDIVYFTNNRRSLKNIISLTNNLIKDNIKRYDKKMIAVNEASKYNDLLITDEDSVNIIETTDKRLNDVILSEMGDLLQSKSAIIYRDNKNAYSISSRLLIEGKFIQIPESKCPAFFKETQLLLDCLELTNHPKSWSNTVKCLPYLFRNISQTKAYEIESKMLATGTVFSKHISNKEDLYTLERLREIYRDSQKREFILALSKLSKIIMDNNKKITYDFQPSIEYFTMLIDKHNPESVKHLVTIFQSEMYKYKTLLVNQGRGISFMTVHKSKGLEFDYVYVLPFDYSNSPKKTVTESIKSEELKKDYIEEERRILYVALTRAKYKLRYFVTDKEHIFNKNLLNYFNKELNNGKKEAINFEWSCSEIS